MNRTRIERRWSETGRMAFLGGCFLGGGAWLTTTRWSLFAAMPLAAGAMAVVRAIRSVGEADCPGCGARVGELRTSANDGILCSACHCFLEGTGGELWLTANDRLADKPIFGAEMPIGEPIFPPLCTTCLAPATRKLQLRVQLPRGRHVTQRYSCSVPSCERHGVGAVRIVIHAPLRFGFRSYAYQRAFCEANGVRPVQLV